MAWQADVTSATYHNNCAAERSQAESAMKLAGVANPEIHQGWFQTTVPQFARDAAPIALLRLDGDWYESTMTCLEHLFPLVVSGGVVIVDDYGTWDGCSRAVHRYLADNDRPESILRTPANVAYLVKR